MLETTVRIKPVDRDGPSIVIFKEANSGKVAIGRGEFLRCADKKVSRVHAELQLDVDGQVRLTPLHVNPCYYFRGGEEQNRQEVRKGEQKILDEGDHFSLLPNTYVYKVVIERVDSCGTDTKSKNGESKSLNNVAVESVSLQVNGNTEPQSPGLLGTTNVAQQSNNTKEVTGDSHTESGNGTRKRTLPAWLLEAADQSPETSEVSSVKSKKKPGRSKVAANKIDNKEKPSTSGRKDFSDSSSDDEQNGGAVAKTSTVKPKKKDDENSTSTTKNVKRISCTFGDQCYRKNPAHFEEYCHPEDPDYVKDASDLQEAQVDSDENDVDDNRPQCEYGYDCYRKNAQHRAEYKHTLRPTTKRRAAKEAKKKASRKGDDIDDESYDDSFIDDDSDEYVPSKDDANYSGDDEDLKRMNKEAESFIKNQKLHQIPK